MAGGIRVTGTPSTGMVVLNVEHDKEYDLMQVAERFEIDYYEPKTPRQKLVYLAALDARAHEVGKHAISTYERLKGWRFYSSRKVTLDLSEAQYELDKAGEAVDHGQLLQVRGKKAYVVKIWFIVPKQRIEVITPEPDDPDVTDGFVNPYNIKEFVDLSHGFKSGLKKEVN